VSPQRQSNWHNSYINYSDFYFKVQRQYEDFLMYKTIETMLYFDHCSNGLYSLYLQIWRCSSGWRCICIFLEAVYYIYFSNFSLNLIGSLFTILGFCGCRMVPTFWLHYSMFLGYQNVNFAVVLLLPKLYFHFFYFVQWADLALPPLKKSFQSIFS
jgi:hypothetical protein